MNARATSSAPTPVSATIREAKVMPIELMTSLVTMVATISRRSGWAASRWPNRSTDGRREVLAQRLVQVGIVGERRGEHLLAQQPLGVGQEHAQLGAGEPRPGGAPLGHLLGGGQELERPLEQPAPLELDHQILVGLHPLRRGHELLAQDLHLQVVVVEDVRDHVAGDALQHLVSLLERQVAGLHGQPQQDLQVDLVVGAVDPAGVVDRIGVDAAAARRRTRSGRAG